MYFIKSEHSRLQMDMGNGQKKTLGYISLPAIPQADDDIRTLRSFRQTGGDLFEEDRKLLNDFEKQRAKAEQICKMGRTFLNDLIEVINAQSPVSTQENVRQETLAEADFSYDIKAKNHNQVASLSGYSVTERDMAHEEKISQDFISLTIRSKHLHPAANVEIVEIFFDTRAMNINEMIVESMVMDVQAKRWQAAQEQTEHYLSKFGRDI